MRSAISGCLAAVDPRRVYLCDPPGALTPWDGRAIPDRVHSLWITDGPCQSWVLQVLIYDDRGEDVIYRRDPRIRWAKRVHSFRCRGVPIVNPIVSLLFKLNRPELEAKDGVDLVALIESVAGAAGLTPGLVDEAPGTDPESAS